jgi:hypothetical protein
VTGAQQPQRSRRIGVLMNLAENDPESVARIATCAQGLDHKNRLRVSLQGADGRRMRPHHRGCD